MQNIIVEVMKILVFTSVLFVWGIRYQNIVSEFKKYGYAAWIRDLVGILKISFAIMIISKENELIQIGSLGISILMAAAIVTHLRVKNTFPLMIPSMSLLGFCLLILFSTFSS